MSAIGSVWRADEKIRTSMSFSVNAKHCLSCSWGELKEHDRHRPPNPISSSISFNILFDSKAAANFGLDVNVCNKMCADSNVTEFWQWSKISSRREIIGLHLKQETISTSKSGRIGGRSSREQAARDR